MSNSNKMAKSRDMMIASTISGLFGSFCMVEYLSKFTPHIIKSNEELLKKYDLLEKSDPCYIDAGNDDHHVELLQTMMDMGLISPKSIEMREHFAKNSSLNNAYFDESGQLVWGAANDTEFYPYYPLNEIFVFANNCSSFEEMMVSSYENENDVKKILPKEKISDFLEDAKENYFVNFLFIFTIDVFMSYFKIFTHTVLGNECDGNSEESSAFADAWEALGVKFGNENWENKENETSGYNDFLKAWIGAYATVNRYLLKNEENYAEKIKIYLSNLIDITVNSLDIYSTPCLFDKKNLESIAYEAIDNAMKGDGKEPINKLIDVLVKVKEKSQEKHQAVFQKLINQLNTFNAIDGILHELHTQNEIAQISNL